MSIVIAAAVFCAPHGTNNKTDSAVAAFASNSGGSAYIAAELTTETVLKEHNADVRLPMASTTKVMTALLICEDCNLDRVVAVPDGAVGVEGSSIYLKRGEEIDVRDLLYGLMLRSGNDASVALAIIHSGSVSDFIARMNERARELGAENTNFTNPNGLPDENHYTTARDLCKISCAAMRNDIFRKVVGTRNWNGRYRSYSNKNKMLARYSGATGIKTGYTVKAGRCLVSSALRGGMEIVCVALNVYDMYERSSEILDECFGTYELVHMPKNARFICGNDICRAEEANFVIKKGLPLTYKTEKNTADGSSSYGNLKIYQENNLIFSAKLYSIV